MKQEYLDMFGVEKEEDINWNYISSDQKLSEEFIREFKDKVYWYSISRYQKLSEEFIREFKDKVNWYSISRYQKLSEEFIKEFNLNISENNWLYVDKETKLKTIKDCGLYEKVDDEYIIAYKSTRLDGYSCFNFQYKYEVGETYESHCDCDLDNENSFGLSVWTKEKALDYNKKGELYKVRVNIEDIGAIVHKGGKLRCLKIEILERI